MDLYLFFTQQYFTLFFNFSFSLSTFVNKVSTGRAVLEAERFRKSPKEALAICRLFPWNQSILILPKEK